MLWLLTQAFRSSARTLCDFVSGKQNCKLQVFRSTLSISHERCFICFVARSSTQSYGLGHLQSRLLVTKAVPTSETTNVDKQSQTYIYIHIYIYIHTNVHYTGNFKLDHKRKSTKGCAKRSALSHQQHSLIGLHTWCESFMDNQSFRSFAFNLAIEGDNPMPFIEYRVMNKNKTNTYIIVYIYIISMSIPHSFALVRLLILIVKNAFWKTIPSPTSDFIGSEVETLEVITMSNP